MAIYLEGYKSIKIVFLVLICIIVIIRINKASREYYPRQGVKPPAGTLIDYNQGNNVN